METRVNEIANGIFRLSTFVPEVSPAGFTFNQFLVLGEQPLLFHTGPRRMFPLVRAAVERIVPASGLRWISFGHVEADECGSMNEWLALAPQAQVAHGDTAVSVSLNDLADRAPRLLANGEVIDLSDDEEEEAAAETVEAAETATGTAEAATGKAAEAEDASEADAESTED